MRLGTEGRSAATLLRNQHHLLIRQLNMSILLCGISDLVMFEITLYMSRSLQKSSHE
jgi:hypothetical protein